MFNLRRIPSYSRVAIIAWSYRATCRARQSIGCLAPQGGHICCSICSHIEKIALSFKGRYSRSSQVKKILICLLFGASMAHAMPPVTGEFECITTAFGVPSSQKFNASLIAEGEKLILKGFSLSKDVEKEVIPCVNDENISAGPGIAISKSNSCEDTYIIESEIVTSNTASLAQSLVVQAVDTNTVVVAKMTKTTANREVAEISIAHVCVRRGN
jgi:hypothetical protein